MTPDAETPLVYIEAVTRVARNRGAEQEDARDGAPAIRLEVQTGLWILADGSAKGTRLDDHVGRGHGREARSPVVLRDHTREADTATTGVSGQQDSVEVELAQGHVLDQDVLGVAHQDPDTPLRVAGPAAHQDAAPDHDIRDRCDGEDPALGARDVRGEDRGAANVDPGVALESYAEACVDSKRSRAEDHGVSGPESIDGSLDGSGVIGDPIAHGAVVADVNAAAAAGEAGSLFGEGGL